ncbi:hypothetical protein LCGC14_0994510 [marine sediment metagenome]|uniref:Uncharacterized protein n=1 Tax=marine sediment metagenome TaxID=412755 RepID=A0A0F9N4T7_9ZZZZ
MIVTVLRRRLIFAPIKPSSVIKHFDGIEHIFSFYNLAREYLPEDVDKLMLKEYSTAAGEFVKLFSKRYFPIMRNRHYYYGERVESGILKSVTKNVVVEWHGMREWEYDSGGQMSSGRLLASVICVCPIEEGSRIPVLERFQKLVGDNFKLPVEGLPLAQVETALADSPYPGLLLWCRWLFSQTGNVWLGTAGRSPSPDWDRETVDQLAADWVNYPGMAAQMAEFDKWLKVDVKKRSAEILKYIRTRPKSLAEVFVGRSRDWNELPQEGNND